MTMKQKFMTITFSWKILDKKIEFLEIGPFRKLAKTFSYKRYQFDFYTNVVGIKAKYFKYKSNPLKHFFSWEIFKCQILKKNLIHNLFVYVAILTNYRS